MYAILVILLGLAGVITVGYFFARLTDPANNSRRQEAQAPPAYPPTPYPYPIPPQAEMRQAPGISLWPIIILMGIAIAAYYYLADQAKPAEKPAEPEARYEVSPTPNNYSSRSGNSSTTGPEEYTLSDQLRDQRKGYVVPLPTPRISDTTKEKQDSYRDNYRERALDNPPAQLAANYRQGYGVQLFAQGKDWWDEAYLQRIQQSYPRLQLLAGYAYPNGQLQMTKFILGAFETKAEADSFARLIGKEFDGAFTTDLSKLQRVERFWPYP